MKKYLAVLILILPFVSFEAKADQFGGSHSCGFSQCAGAFDIYTTVRPMVLTFLDCDPGGDPCQLGVQNHVYAHVTVTGDPEVGNQLFHVRWRVETNPDGSKILVGHSVTNGCSSPAKPPHTPK